MKELDLVFELDPTVFYTENQFQYFAVGALEGLILLDELFPVPEGRQVLFMNGASFSSLMEYVTVKDAVILNAKVHS